ncbi:MAG: diaminopimelate epimerase, partial [Oscillospiraceae bacterium]|nr:diaminopimelate epimerase [Oscillospiraceae bacterium]
MKFTKIQGAGNDFIIIDNRSGEISRDSYPALAKSLCARRLSIGADGLMMVERPEAGGDLQMVFYN